MLEAITRCKIFRLVETSGFSYVDVGIPKLSTGAYPDKVIAEHLKMKEYYQKAIEDSRK